MLSFRYSDGRVYANGSELVSIISPFRSKADVRRDAGFSRYKHFTPKMLSGEYKHRYRCWKAPLNKHIVYTLHSCFAGGYSSQAVWHVSDSLGKIYKAQALLEFEYALGRLPEVIKPMQMVLNMVLQSYSFERIITTSEAISSNFNFAVPIQYHPLRLVRQIPEEKERHRSINNLLRHHGSLPLVSMPRDVFDVITLEHLAEEVFQEGKKTLILSWTNPWVGSWLYQQLAPLGNEESLAVQLFRNRCHKNQVV